ncbi:copper(I)-binding protein [Novosphingobium chloroacetimidivorans]|uniref:Copper(I)-binding protein n=1 Tax=Novosphingobium chloroacetimidivorans TaxID=1428314 RepID=A0A7W7NU35_9SPHN|nr:copper chaperone PCu(A)C [Novosphingobium chloroacetimidivorans]MBB4856761.1 copper(I)-binding protein [Novosphingobium chloroacetimidivorans]
MRMHRTALLSALLLAAAITGCKGGEAPAPETSTGANESVDALGPDAKPGVTAGAARLVLPVIAGRPGVVYFRVANNTSAKITLAGVHVQGAGKAEMHRTSGGKMTPVEQVPIDAGASIAFVPGGLHIMAFDIEPSLKAGDRSELTLTFSDGDKISVPLKVEAMGANSGGMAGMSH